MERTFRLIYRCIWTPRRPCDIAPLFIREPRELPDQFGQIPPHHG
jgi:hypothetical protein